MSNQFLAFGTGGGANTLTATAYAAAGLATLRSGGFTAGVASSTQVNTILRQTTSVAAAFGTFINDAGFNAVDDGNITNLKTAFLNALKATCLALTGGTLTGALRLSSATALSGIYSEAASTDAFTVDTDKVLHNYGLAWKSFSDATLGPSAALSGFGGIREYTGGVERRRLDAEGRMGLKTVPAGWQSSIAGQASLDIGATFGVWTHNDGTSYLAHNLYYSGTNWIRKVLGGAALVEMNGTGLRALLAPSAAGASVATFAYETLLIAEEQMVLRRDHATSYPRFVLKNKTGNAASHVYGAFLFDAWRDVADPAYVAGITAEGINSVGATGNLIFRVTASNLPDQNLPAAQATLSAGSFNSKRLSAHPTLAQPNWGADGDLFANRGNGSGVVYLGNNTAYLYYDGLNYELGAAGANLFIAGSSVVKFSDYTANQNLSTSGYQRLPGGLILQWGRITMTFGQVTTVTFPLTFPNACFVVIPHLEGYGGVIESGVSITGRTLPSFTCSHNWAGDVSGSPITTTVAWYALGR